MLAATDTIAALATPAGVSALAVIRVSGVDTTRLAGELLGTPPHPRHVRRAAYRTRDGALLDDALFTFFQGPRSYTGEDALEISCHGNPLIARRILDDLFARGCRAAEPGEFTQRAFLHGRMDLSQAEAVMDVIHARSERALAAAQRQLQGALGRRMASLTDRLLLALARIEAYIDFPEEDLPAEDREGVRSEIESILFEINGLIATNPYGELLRGGMKTVIVGPPNAGKSSLLNRLVGRERALVSAEPGTTRDFLEEQITVGPHSLRLIDTAGLNPAPTSIERRGIEKTREQLALADLVMVVVDGSLPYPTLEMELSGVPVICVANKCDLVVTVRPMAQFQDAETIGVSALTGAGMDELVAAIVRQADRKQTETGEEAVAISARHAQALTRAREGLEQGRLNLQRDEPAELLASDLRSAVEAFGEISGRIDNEAMLDRLFATFCIGK